MAPARGEVQPEILRLPLEPSHQHDATPCRDMGGKTVTTSPPKPPGSIHAERAVRTAARCTPERVRRIALRNSRRGIGKRSVKGVRRCNPVGKTPSPQQ